MALEHKPTFGALLKRYRIASGLTQEELAAQAGMSTRGVSDLERGARRAPYKSTIALLSEALHLSAQEHAALVVAAGRSAGATVTPLLLLGLTGSTPSDLPLVGRRHELADLDRYLAGEGPPVLFLTGEPGIGKTRLLQESARLASARGWTVLEGGCQSRNGQEPYAPFLGALSSHLMREPLVRKRRELTGCSWLVRLLPELADAQLVPPVAWSLPPEQERRLMFSAVRLYLANIANAMGTLVILDDLQWAGMDALDLLMALVRSTDQPPLRLLCAYRDSEVGPGHTLASPIADLAHARLATQVELRPLGRSEATDLLTAVFGELGLRFDDNDELCARVVQRTGGVPFFLMSYAHAIRPEAVDSDAEDTIPWNVTQSISQRIALLPEKAREILDVAAAIGRVIPDSLLLEVFGESDSNAVPALDAVCQAHLLVESDANTYQFAHDLIHDVVAANLSTVRRKLLHRRIAEVLERHLDETSVELLAYHYELAGDQHKTIAYLEQAGDRAQGMRAYADAERYFRDLLRRVEVVHWKAADVARIREKLGTVLYAAARFEAAVESLNLAAQAYRSAHDLEGWGRTLTRLGWAHVQRGTAGEGLSLLESSIDTLAKAGISSVTLAEINIALAQLYSVKLDFTAMLEAGDRAVNLARAANDRRLHAQAQLNCGHALNGLDKPDALSVIEQVIPEAEDVEDLLTLSEALNTLGQMYESRGEFGKSVPMMDRALEVAGQLGDPVQQALLMCNRGQSAFYVGRWDEACIYHEKAVAVMSLLETSLVSSYPHGGLGLLHLVQGRTELGLHHLHTLQAASQAGGDIGAQRYVTCILAEHEMLEGNPEGALALLQPLLDRPGHEEKGVVKLLPLVAWAYHVLGNAKNAERTIEEWMRRVSRHDMTRQRADGLRIKAMIAQSGCQTNLARNTLEEALSLCETMSYPYGKAKTLYIYGLVLKEQAEVPFAREYLEMAQAILQELGEREYSRVVSLAIGDLEYSN
jgi:tetratricopeptide (TPR) repeat protein/transcriptional regulator with XRE-family HTH domain